MIIPTNRATRSLYLTKTEYIGGPPTLDFGNK